MKARIVKDSIGYYGEVYGTWSNTLLGTRWEGWNRVTDCYLTRYGAKYGLQKWKQKEFPDEFDI